MTSSFSINGLGGVARFGCGKEDMWAQLQSPEISCTTVPVALKDEVVDLAVYQADLSPLSTYFKTRTVRRMNRFSKMITLAAHEALLDAGIAETVDRSRLGLVVATGYGSTATTFEFLDSYHENDDSYVSPLTFSNSVHAAGMSTASIIMDITGPAVTVNQLEQSVPLALHTACHWLATGRADHVLVGGADEYCDMLGYTYASLFGASASDRIDIRTIDKQTAIPGEGAAFMLLSRDPLPSHYAYLNSVEYMMNDPGAPPADLRIVGIDGHKTCGKAYTTLPNEPMRTISLANLVGSLPVNPAFDLMAGALMLHRNSLCHDDYSLSPGALTPVDINTVDIFKADDENRISRIRLARSAEKG